MLPGAECQVGALEHGRNQNKNSIVSTTIGMIISIGISIMNLINYEQAQLGTSDMLLPIGLDGLPLTFLVRPAALRQVL